MVSESGQNPGTLHAAVTGAVGLPLGAAFPAYAFAYSSTSDATLPLQQLGCEAAQKKPDNQIFRITDPLAKPRVGGSL